MSDLPTARSGRYAGTPSTTYTGPDKRQIVYLGRRFVPQPEQLALVQEHVVRPGERLDHIAAHHMSDPELFWRICDANRAMDPAELAVPGRRLRITLALEMSWGGQGSIDA
jgi:hypothetical protein